MEILLTAGKRNTHKKNSAAVECWPFQVEADEGSGVGVGGVGCDYRPGGGRDPRETLTVNPPSIPQRGEERCERLSAGAQHIFFLAEKFILRKIKKATSSSCRSSSINSSPGIKRTNFSLSSCKVLQ